MNRDSRIPLSTPHMSGGEEALVAEAIASGWVTQLGTQVDLFEEEFASAVGAPHAVATSSGTAALHLALILAGVEPGDEVFVSSLTFAASVNPIVYCGGVPVFIDSEAESWNMDPCLLEDALRDRAARGRMPRAVVLVHLYGQSANIRPILDLCEHYGVRLVEDAAEALGATYYGRSPGSFGHTGIFSFNGNKIITTGGGGMLVSSDLRLTERAQKLAAQARDPAPHYEHSEIGYNYRMSNVLAAIGRAQLRVLEDRVATRRRIFDRYRSALAAFSGLEFMPEAPWGRHTRWLTTLMVDPDRAGLDRERLRLWLDGEDIEARPVWKPMHMQPVFAGCEVYGGAVAERLFEHGLCLPSSSNMIDADLERVVAAMRTLLRISSRAEVVA